MLAGGLETGIRAEIASKRERGQSGWKGMAQTSPTSVVLVHVSKEGLAGKHDLEVQASAALDEARAMPHGPERTEAMKKAGKTLRYAKNLFPSRDGLREPKLVSAPRKQL